MRKLLIAATLMAGGLGLASCVGSESPPTYQYYGANRGNSSSPTYYNPTYYGNDRPRYDRWQDRDGRARRVDEGWNDRDNRGSNDRDRSRDQE